MLFSLVISSLDFPYYTNLGVRSELKSLEAALELLASWLEAVFCLPAVNALDAALAPALAEAVLGLVDP